MTSFLIGPYDQSDRPDIWNLNQNNNNWEQQGTVEEAVADPENYELRARFNKIQRVEGVSDRVKAAKACGRSISDKKVTYPFHIDFISIFSLITGIKNNWLRMNDIVWGYERANIFKIRKGKAQKYPETDSSKINGMMTVEQVEQYLRQYYDDPDEYIRYNLLLKYGNVILSRMFIRMQQLFETHNLASMFYYLMCFYGTWDAFERDLLLARNFPFRNKTGTREGKIFKKCNEMWLNAWEEHDITIPMPNNNSSTTTATPTKTLSKNDLIRTLMFYLVRTAPQLYRAGGLEGMQMEKVKQGTHKKRKREEFAKRQKKF